MSLKYPQHIKKTCDSKTFQAIESGARPFEIKLADFKIEEGDYITFIETIEGEGGKREETGRKVMRRVTYSEDLRAFFTTHEQAVKEQGAEILGLSEPESKLGSTLSENFMMAFVIDKFESEWELSQGPNYWPMLLCPPILESGIVDDLGFDHWPIGVYPCHFTIRPEFKSEGEPVNLDVIDYLILALVQNEDHIVGLEVNPDSLKLGQCIGIHGHSIEPVHPSIVADYFEIPSPTPLLSIGNFPDIEHMTRDQVERLVDSIDEESTTDQIQTVIDDLLEARPTNHDRKI